MRSVVEFAFAFVRSQVGDDVPRDITGPEIPPYVGAESGILWGWLIPLAVLAAIAVGVALTRFWRSKSRPLSAADYALRQLDRVQKLQLVKRNRKDHFKLLAGVLRRYFEKGCGVSASRLTTAEFLERVAQTARLEGHLPFLQAFLHDCDIAKFAPPDAVADRARELEASLRGWLVAQNAAPNSAAALDAPAPASKMSDS